MSSLVHNLARGFWFYFQLAITLFCCAHPKVSVVPFCWSWHFLLAAPLFAVRAFFVGAPFFADLHFHMMVRFFDGTTLICWVEIPDGACASADVHPFCWKSFLDDWHVFCQQATFLLDFFWWLRPFAAVRFQLVALFSGGRVHFCWDFFRGGRCVFC